MGNISIRRLSQATLDKYRRQVAAGTPLTSRQRSALEGHLAITNSDWVAALLRPDVLPPSEEEIAPMREALLRSWAQPVTVVRPPAPACVVYLSSPHDRYKFEYGYAYPFATLQMALDHCEAEVDGVATPWEVYQTCIVRLVRRESGRGYCQHLRGFDLTEDATTPRNMLLENLPDGMITTYGE